MCAWRNDQMEENCLRHLKNQVTIIAITGTRDRKQTQLQVNTVL